MVRNSHTQFKEHSRIDAIGNFCCKRLEDENEKLRSLLISERQKFKRLNALYQQLLASFSLHNIGTTVSSFGSNDNQTSSSETLAEKPEGRPVHAAKRREVSIPVEDKHRSDFGGTEGGSRLFYFIDSNGVAREPSVSLSDAQQAKLSNFLRNSELRQQRIREVSRRRAVFAAHRRAAACNLMRGNVDFENVDDLLMTDLTKIEAFPRRQMAQDTIRRMQRSVNYIDRQRKRHFEIDKAINNVLSYCFSQNVKCCDRKDHSRNKIDTRIEQARRRLQKQRLT
uniref:BZIP domain-containing protein n=1 Tax=Steinernema glaseri TaxID=37863 RepID=A0A1I7ZI47_9BILA